jgi:hypothetical protein
MVPWQLNRIGFAVPRTGSMPIRILSSDPMAREHQNGSSTGAGPRTWCTPHGALSPSPQGYRHAQDDLAVKVGTLHASDPKVSSHSAGRLWHGTVAALDAKGS